jgi:transcriptional regulator with XRE-family HTH domain
MVALQNMASRLNDRRKRLGMTITVIAGRSHLSRRTVERFFSGQDADPSFTTVLKISEAIGASLDLQETDPVAFRRQQAERKASIVVAVVQGTSALESQAVENTTINLIRDQTVAKLLAGSGRALWSE